MSRLQDMDVVAESFDESVNILFLFEQPDQLYF